jgi:hypothetical protein
MRAVEILFVSVTRCKEVCMHAADAADAAITCCSVEGTTHWSRNLRHLHPLSQTVESAAAHLMLSSLLAPLQEKTAGCIGTKSLGTVPSLVRDKTRTDSSASHTANRPQLQLQPAMLIVLSSGCACILVSTQIVPMCSSSRGLVRAVDRGAIAALC